MQPTKDGGNPSRCSLWNTVTTAQVKKDQNGDSQNASDFMQIELGKIGLSLLHSISSKEIKMKKVVPFPLHFLLLLQLGKEGPVDIKLKKKK